MPYRKKLHDHTTGPLKDGSEFFGPLFETEEAAQNTLKRPSYLGPKGTSCQIHEVKEDHLTFAGRNWEPYGNKVLNSGPWSLRKLAGDIALKYDREEVARYEGAIKTSTERGPADITDRTFLESWVAANEDWLAEHIG